MARTKTVLGTGARLSAFLSASLLARVFPAEVVNELLDAHGCKSQRIRTFPAVAGIYYCMALSLYPAAAYEEVFSVVSQGLAWASGAAEAAGVGKASISRVRGRIGPAPLHHLIDRCCTPMADAGSRPHAFYGGLRLMAIDGSNFEVPDEADNVKGFGYPGSRTGHAGYPQAQCAILVECATHAILGANIGAYPTGEWDICEPLLEKLDASVLLLADRGFDGHEHWRKATATGPQMLWRCKNNRQLAVLQELDDGSYLSTIHPSIHPSRPGTVRRACHYSGLRVGSVFLPAKKDLTLGPLVSMSLLESTFGKEITTRALETVRRCSAA